MLLHGNVRSFVSDATCCLRVSSVALLFLFSVVFVQLCCSGEIWPGVKTVHVSGSFGAL